MWNSIAERRLWRRSRLLPPSARIEGATVFELVNAEGEVAMMRSGMPFRYTSRNLARMAKIAMEGKKRPARWHVRAVQR